MCSSDLVTRSPADPPHYAFGGGGEYYCQGAALTYRILSVTLRGILRRMPGIELAGPVRYEPSAFVTALASLPVRFDRADAGDGVSRERQLIAELEQLTGKEVVLQD